MRVLYDYNIFSNPGYGGIPRYFVELASRLSRYPDTSIRIVSPLILSPFLAERRGELPTLGIDISHIHRLSPRLIRPINKLIFDAFASASRPDIIHETHYSCARRSSHKTKIVTTIHDAIPERLPHLFPLVEKHRLEKSASLRRADHIICVSESTKRDLLEFYEVDPSCVSVIPLGSSIQAASAGPVDLGSPYFLHVGTRYKHKNFASLIQAFGESRLYQTHKLVTFCAWPLSTSELDQLAAAQIPTDRVISIGGNDDLLAQFYAGADALVFPSLYEGFGIPLLEAMQCGCPIITSNTSSLPEVAADAALYCDPEDVPSLAHAMTQVASSPEIRRDLIVKGRQRALNFSWEQCSAQTYEVYRKLL